MPHHDTTPTRDARLVPLADAAEYFHVSVKTLRRRIADGDHGVPRWSAHPGRSRPVEAALDGPNPDGAPRLTILKTTASHGVSI